LHSPGGSINLGEGSRSLIVSSILGILPRRQYNIINRRVLCVVRCAVLNKGQVLTDYYRLMNRHGGYVWLQTCATIICNAKNVDEQNIIAINYVLRYTHIWLSFTL